MTELKRLSVREAALSGASALVLGMAAPMAFAPAYAQATQDDAQSISTDTDTESVDEAYDDDYTDEIVVTGVRSALESAQDIKRNADTVVDSITATDIGAFPDKSVAEALQRVAGITVNRFAASSDTAHFSAEPSGVIVRGLQQVRSEFNGRDTFSANSSRGLSWNDVSPELMSGVDTYKNQTAELIEGGIAGSINLRTRVPFDQEGQLIAVSANANYNSLAEETTPEFSALYSNRWETGAGEFGFMVNGAYSEVQTKSEGTQLYRMTRYCNQPYNTPDGRDASYSAPGFAVFTDPRYDEFEQISCTNDGVTTDEDGIFFVPSRVLFRDNTYFRERTGIAAAAQWESLDGDILATLQYNRSQYDQRWEEYVISTSPADFSFGQSLFYTVPYTNADNNGQAPQAAVGSGPLVFNDQGLFQSGLLTADTGWWGNPTDPGADQPSGFLVNGDGEALVNACYGWNGCSPRQRGLDSETVTRSNNNKNLTEDIGLNVKYEATDRLRFNFDAQYVQSTVENYDIEGSLQFFANADLDISGEYPRLTLLPGTNINYGDGETVLGSDGLPDENLNAEYQSNVYGSEVFEDPNNYFIRSIMDHVEDSEGTEVALRGDAEYDFADSGFLRSLKVGARYANRDQTVRNSAYNWQNVANAWSQNASIASPLAGPSGSFAGWPEYGVRTELFGLDLGDDPINPGVFVFFDMDLLQDQQGFANAYGSQAVGFDEPSAQGWWPICSNAGDRNEEVAGTCFTPGEIADVQEETLAAYAQLNFGGDQAEIFGIPFSGNVGVRFVRTMNTSTGGINVPDLSDGARTIYVPRFEDDGVTPVIDPVTGNQEVETIDANGDTQDDRVPLGASYADFQDQACATRNSQENQETGVRTAPAVPLTLACYIDEATYNFISGGSILSTAENDFDRWLPSFNIRFDLTDETLLRFAASRAMSRPDIGNLRNYLGFGASLPQGDDLSFYATDGAGNVTGVNPFYSGSAQNPFLLPVMANQFDLSLEHYFSEVGSLTFAVFYKEFEDYIQVGQYFRDITVNGVTNTVQVRGPLNGEGASIQGFEVAYQQFFDFLPAPFDGFGVQANYTYVDNQGIENGGVTNGGASGDGTTSGQFGDGEDYPRSIAVDRLEGLSDHAYNLVAMYEKGPLALRAAYNWRSEYLVTAIDCCVASPIWTEDQGFLDASVRYRVNDNIELSLQGQNLLNTKTITQQQVQNSEDGGFRLPGSKFQNDTRLTFGLRMKY